MKLDLYEASPEYISYLRQFDSNVLAEKTTFKQRRYVGTVITIDSKNYFLPLSSPKGRHRFLGSSLDIYKLDSGNLGIINLNKMIPIKRECLEKIDFKKVSDQRYKGLLKKQYYILNEKSSVIHNRAERIYNIATKREELKEFEIKLKERCCNFQLLEEQAKQYHY